ncbi:hypothetical protein GCM10023318_23780 [Nocardia callitridis]|uniref:Uncharacterized protein n=2 Tax=Nocardia callitridis TaxID=648753 RepID=A0ABP9K5P8_9NOCA
MPVPDIVVRKAQDYGPGWDEELVRAYGLVPDHARMKYYRELWNAT